MDYTWKITTADLMYLNEAAKALKQTEVYVVYDTVMGLYDGGQALSYVKLDRNIIYTGECYFISVKQLSDFIKDITVETEFEMTMDIKANLKCIKNKAKDRLYFHYYSEYPGRIDPRKQLGYCSKFDDSVKKIDIGYIADKLRGMHVSDGYINEIIDNHYVTLFPTMFSLTKPDKLYVQFYDANDNDTFVAKYTIKKKRFIVYTYICYLSI